MSTLKFRIQYVRALFKKPRDYPQFISAETDMHLEELRLNYQYSDYDIELDLFNTAHALEWSPDFPPSPKLYDADYLTVVYRLHEIRKNRPKGHPCTPDDVLNAAVDTPLHARILAARAFREAVQYPRGVVSNSTPGDSCLLTPSDFAKSLNVKETTLRGLEAQCLCFSVPAKTGFAREYPQLQLWPQLKGAPIKRILENLAGCYSKDKFDFFRITTERLQGLSPVQVLSGVSWRPENPVTPKQLELLESPQASRVAAVVDISAIYGRTFSNPLARI